jgi:hypothetical protein
VGNSPVLSQQYNNYFGNTTKLAKIIGTTTYATSYSYNLANELTQISYPSNRVVVPSYDAIGRPCAIGASGSTCTTGTLYASGFAYNVAQQVAGFKYGNGLFASFGLSGDRLQLTCLDYSSTNRSGNCTHDSTTKFGLTYILQDKTYLQRTGMTEDAGALSGQDERGASSG